MLLRFGWINFIMNRLVSNTTNIITSNLSILSYLSKEKYFYIFLTITITTYILYAIGASIVIDFVALNGKFQNFNVVRRLLDGQVPYIDFIPYLGLGHLWLTGILTKLLGGTFGANVLVCNIITALICPITIFGLSRCYLKHNGFIPFVLCMFIIGLDIFKTESGRHFVFFNILDVGLSARGIRSMILPLCIIMYGGWVQLAQKIKNNKAADIIKLLGLSAIAGFAFCWSNDYGPCLLIATYIMTLMIKLIRTHSGLACARTFMIMLCSNAIFIIITAFILSEGHLLAWLKGNFDFTGYQQWFFMIASDKTYYLYQLNHSIYTLLTVCLFVYYLIQIIQNHASEASITRHGIPCFCLLTSFGAVQEYQLFGGGGRSLDEMLCLVLYTTISLETTTRLIHIDKDKVNSIIILSSIMLISCGIQSVIQKNYQNFIYPKNSATYVSSLDGRLKYMYRDVSKTSEFLSHHPGRLFSTYATAAEVITNQFQPSGIDYIIHVLSDDSRSAYMNSLDHSNPRFVTTIRESYSTGRWNRNANWFFHRIIYKYYHIAFRNRYQFFWEKNESNKKNIQMYLETNQTEIKVIDDHQTRITIHAPGCKSGIADVKIDYSTTVHPTIRSKFIINSVVGIFVNHSENGCLQNIQPDGRCDLVKVDAWSLRPTSSEYIPVEIHDGIGTVLLRSYPEDNTSLQLHSAHCSDILIPAETLMLQGAYDAT